MPLRSPAFAVQFPIAAPSLSFRSPECARGRLAKSLRSPANNASQKKRAREKALGESHSIDLERGERAEKG